MRKEYGLTSVRALIKPFNEKSIKLFTGQGFVEDARVTVFDEPFTRYKKHCIKVSYSVYFGLMKSTDWGGVKRARAKRKLLRRIHTLAIGIFAFALGGLIGPYIPRLRLETAYRLQQRNHTPTQLLQGAPLAEKSTRE